jgi:hypothetical protein
MKKARLAYNLVNRGPSWWCSGLSFDIKGKGASIEKKEERVLCVVCQSSKKS